MREGGRWRRVTGSCPRARGPQACGGLYSIPAQPRTYRAWTGATVTEGDRHDEDGYPVGEEALEDYCKEAGGLHPVLRAALQADGGTLEEFLYHAVSLTGSLDEALTLLLNPGPVGATEARLRAVGRDAAVAARARRGAAPAGPTPVAVTPAAPPAPAPSVAAGAGGSASLNPKDLIRRILARYPTRNDLARAVRLELGENLEAISSGENLSDTVFKLVFNWAEAQGRLGDLGRMVGGR